MAGLLVPPFKLNSNNEIIPRSTNITSFTLNAADSTLQLARQLSGAGNLFTILAGGAQAGGTNLAGGQLTLSSGIATGNASSLISFHIAIAGASGTTDRSPTEIAQIKGPASFIIYSTTATFKTYLSSGTTGSFIGTNADPFTANADDTTKPSWFVGYELSNDQLRVRHATSGGSNPKTFTDLFVVDGNSNIIIGSQAALATNAANGFLYIPTCAGIPTGTPTAFTGKVAMVYDTTNNKLYVFNAAWKGVTLA